MSLNPVTMISTAFEKKIHFLERPLHNFVLSLTMYALFS